MEVTGDPVLNLKKVAASVCRNKKISSKRMSVDAKLGRETVKKLLAIRKVLDRTAKLSDSDPQGLLPYWIFAVDAMVHAARKLTVLSVNGRDTTTGRRTLRTEMRGLMRRFEKLWMARNRRSEIRLTLKRYRKAMRSL